MLEGIIDRLIPSDEVGPGGREAGVLRYIDRSLATDYEAHRTTYAKGLAAIDDCSVQRFGQPFSSLPGTRQDVILRDFEQARARSRYQGESEFFELVRQHAIEGMFGDPSWGGNKDQIGWELLSYPGPRPVWTPEEQRLDAVPARSPEAKDADPPRFRPSPPLPHD